MTTLIVVENPKNWPLEIPGIEVVSARKYLTDPTFSALRHTKVFNLCTSYRYQAIGYYVSLLAEARGHKPIPKLSAIQDMKMTSIVRFMSEDVDELIQKSLAPITTDRFTLSIYFGRNLARRYDRLSSSLSKLFHAPMMRAQFIRQKKWQMQSINPIAANDIPENHRPFVLDVATSYFSGHWQRTQKRTKYLYDIALLHNPEEKDPPSDMKALKKFVSAAASLRLNVEFVTKEDYGDIAEFDGLFIRETTNVNHYTYRFARRASAEGLAVIDDPESILKCTNKVFLAELMERHKIPTPKTMVVHRDNIAAIAPELGLPCILKKPDSSFSQGVVKVSTPEELQARVREQLADSELIIAQQFLPTEFDWRIGIIDQKPLFACKYYMVGTHWQIIQRSPDGKRMEGNYETLAVEDAPEAVIRTALKAANLVGNGLYGVDVKEVGGKAYLIEVNDNPNIDGGVEDQIIKDELYLRVMRSFLQRIQSLKGISPT